MEVRSGAEWQLPTGNKQYFDVLLTDAEAMDVHDEEWWTTLTPRQRFQWLSAEADLLVVSHMASQGAITTEFAKHRIEALKVQQKKVTR